MYLGINCPCKACEALTPQERLEKFEHMQEARRRGGKTRAAQESMTEARSAGFWATMERHPFYARKHLRHKIYAQNRARAVRSLIPERTVGRRKPMQ